MAGGSSTTLSRDIQGLFEDGTAVGLTDRQLLDRFAGRRDPSAESAFEALVRRHGPMVLRVCRNALPDPNDAHDAFQATFLVLFRRHGTLRGFDSLGGWLYGVACRVAARARVESARRWSVESRAAARVAEAVESADADDLDRAELGPIVQEEVQRLPERYRSVALLCYWEGLTQEQAAAQLGCPIGTVRSRLARARDLLRRRLTRRGVEPLFLAAESARKLRPLAPELVQATVRTAVQVGGSPIATPVVSGAVVSLVRWMLWRTAMIRFGGVAAGVVLVGMTGYGAGLAAQRAGDSKEPPRPIVAGPGAGAPGATRKAEDRPSQIPTPVKAGEQVQAAVPIKAKLDGEARIIAIAPNGTTVKKGDVICELDSGPLRDQLVSQRVVTRLAEAASQNSRLARELAEVALSEYRDGGFPQQFQEAEGDVQVAKAELALAEAMLNNSKNLGVGAVGPLSIRRDELAVLKARVGLEKAQSRKDLLARYTGPRKTKDLEYAVKKASSEEPVKEANFAMERQKERNLERQIANCTITAPIDGEVERSMIREDDVVRQRQTLFLIKPTQSSAPAKKE